MLKKVSFKFYLIIGFILFCLSIYLYTQIEIAPDIICKNDYVVTHKEVCEICDDDTKNIGMMSICKQCKNVLNLQSIKENNKCKNCNSSQYRYYYEEYVKDLCERQDIEINTVKEYFDYYHFSTIYVCIYATFFVTSCVIFMIGIFKLFKQLKG